MRIYSASSTLVFSYDQWHKNFTNETKYLAALTLIFSYNQLYIKNKHKNDPKNTQKTETLKNSKGHGRGSLMTL